MKVGVQTSPKFKRFVRLLRKSGECGPVSPELVATGLLETLWQVTSQHYKAGDIGKAENDDIAEAVSWYGDGDELVHMLVNSGWLDESDDHRLVVHDWHEHCPTFVKGNLKNAGIEFASKSITKRGTKSPTKSLTKSDTKETDFSDPLPSQAKPSLVIPSQDSPHKPPEGAVAKKPRKKYGEEFENFWSWVPQNFPVRPQDTKGDIFKKFEKLRKAGVEAKQIGIAVRSYGLANMQDPKAIGLRRFLEQATVEQYLTEPPPIQSQRQETEMERIERETIEKFGHLFPEETNQHRQEEIVL